MVFNEHFFAAAAATIRGGNVGRYFWCQTEVLCHALVMAVAAVLEALFKMIEFVALSLYQIWRYMLVQKGENPPAPPKRRKTQVPQRDKSPEYRDVIIEVREH